MSALVALALQAGLPILEKVLSRKLGPATGELASEVIRAVADRAGTTPEEIEAVAAATPGRVIDAMREVERGSVVDKIDLYLRDTEARLATFAAEAEAGGWQSAWRPAGMWLLLALWLWNIVLLHVANAAFRTALPPVPFGDLFQFSALYMGLYMGGHTVKNLAEQWRARG